MVTFYPQLQALLADCLHEQEYALHLVIVLLHIIQTRICSCAGLGASAWLLTCPTTLTFDLFLAHFLTTLRTYFGLPHPMVAHLS